MAIVDARLVQDPLDEELEQAVVGRDVLSRTDAAAVVRLAKQTVDKQKNVIEAKAFGKESDMLTD